MINIPVIPPQFIFILGAIGVPFIKGRTKQLYLLSLPIIAFINLLYLQDGIQWTLRFLDYDLFVYVDKLSLAFAYIFTIMSFAAIIYALNERNDGQYMAALFYIGSALGVVLSGDLFSLLVFWEIMAISSLFLILYRGTKASYKSGFRYLLMHAVGGSCLMAGIAIHVVNTGSIEFGFIGLNDVSSMLIFMGFIINAAIPPLHTWLTDAYPEATIAGTLFLSIYTTKTAVYVLARAFPGSEILIILGTIMTVYPIFYAVIENDTRRVLAYSLISQVGFMIVGIGIGTPLALNGSVAHAFCNILFEGLLFMCTGAILYVTGTSKYTELGGLYRSMPLTLIFCLIGAASISAFPFFNGFISKSMIIDAVMERDMLIIWLAMLFASAGTIHYAGIKIPYFIFFANDSGKRPNEPPINMLISMGLVAFLCIIIGIFPSITYGILPYTIEFTPYTVEHILDQLQLIFFVAFGSLLLMTVGLYPPNQRSVNLDVDWFYRKFAQLVIWFCEKPLLEFATFLDRKSRDIGGSFLWFSANPLNSIRIIKNLFHLMFVSTDDEMEIRIKLEKYKLKHLEKHEYMGISIGILALIIILVLYLLTTIIL